jgi:hypothetical protein
MHAHRLKGSVFDVCKLPPDLTTIIKKYVTTLNNKFDKIFLSKPTPIWSSCLGSTISI